MYIQATILASLLVSASALATPHGVGYSMHRRHQHSVLAKVRAPPPAHAVQALEASAAVPKKQLRKRCKPRKTTLAPASTSTSALSAPANVAPLPSSVDTTSNADPTSSARPAPPPSSAAPSPSSSSAAPPPPSSSQPAPSPSPAPSPTSSGGQSGSLFSGTQMGGDGTFYGTGLGACGITNNDSQDIAAVSEILFDSYPGYDGVNPNQNPVCGKQVAVNFQGKSVTVTITDRCVACKAKDLDFSPAAFDQLADPSVGRIHDISWTWL